MTQGLIHDFFGISKYQPHANGPSSNTFDRFSRAGHESYLTGLPSHRHESLHEVKDSPSVIEYAPNPFDKLPIETVQNIASFINVDKDLANFRRISRSTHDAVDGDNGSFWRRYFLSKYEKPAWTKATNESYKMTYRRRQVALNRPHLRTFDIGETEIEKDCLMVVRDLILESFSEKHKAVDPQLYESANLIKILQLMPLNNLIECICKTPSERLKKIRKGINVTPSRLLQTIHVLLAPQVLDIKHPRETFNYPQSQIVAYGTKESFPMFEGSYGLDININMIMHNLNFWKYQMTTRHEPLFSAFENLDNSERPRFWTDKLQQGCSKLGKKWKSSYAFVERWEIPIIRQEESCGSPVIDQFNKDMEETGAFQDMTLGLVDAKEAIWSESWDEILAADTQLPKKRATTRAQRRSAAPDYEPLLPSLNLEATFEGEGHDSGENFLATGKLSSLPPQEGIPGWQRLSMMKYYVDPNTGAIDHDALWAYEGVVLPGGQIILGRWWSPYEGTGEEMYSGPFILWCVDGAETAE